MECGNPQYLEWIGEWMEHARENNNRSYYIYRKAYESMAKYPTRFNHPMEAMCLAGIGEKLVGMLEKKLAVYCKENDLPMPAFKKRKPTKIGAVDEDEEPKPKKPRQKSKPYVPTYRSGPYAILLALLDAKESNGEECLTKHQITNQGQIYCDASLTNPEHGKFYTAWSSMKTLLGKNLVYQSGHKYYLTPEGTSIAKTMKEAEPTAAASADRDEPQENTRASTSPRRPRPSDTLDRSHKSSRPDADRQSSSTSGSKVTASRSTPSADAQRSSSHRHSLDAYDEDADTALDYSQGDRRLSETRTVARTHNAPSSSASFSRPPPSTSSSYLSISARSVLSATNRLGKDEPLTIFSVSDDDDIGAQSLDSRSDLYDRSSKASSSSTIGETSGGAYSYSRHHASPARPRLPITGVGAASHSYAGTAAEKSASSLPRHASATSLRDSTYARSSSLVGSSEAISSKPKHNPFTHLSESTLARSTSASGVAALGIEKLARFQPIIFLPGTFDICLVLDIREVRTKTDRDYIGQKLTERGINVSKRVLEVGDILWVARLKDPSPSGPDEIVLDYIVERKRMDDLVFSIKDGRFNEQKFRLKRSGLGNPIYLVETFKVGETYDIGADAIRTAMVKTQVQDGFFLKRTDHTDQTIDYLVSLTGALKRLHESETLYAIPDDAVHRSNYLELQDHLKEKFPDRTYLTSYQAFGSLNGKSDTLAVRDTFVKMLMTIRGVSSEKAVQLARAYGTPRAMFSALDGAEDGRGKAKRKHILAQTNSPVSRRNISEGLSAKIAEIWYADEYP
ncbi:Crossover junction endonuclease mus81 [Mortierella alpina]|uniref:Crossover junction endonuclease MUS81 n=1 Tax=Mortierella alpina TaxID=64518 RepID=A0A9P6M551_MORAP|nr:Crossover junction endonuclease mus81 [Mortierella alpina]